MSCPDCGGRQLLARVAGVFVVRLDHAALCPWLADWCYPMSDEEIRYPMPEPISWGELRVIDATHAELVKITEHGVERIAMQPSPSGHGWVRAR